MSTVKVGINGFGRIGKLVFRSGLMNHQHGRGCQINAINDPSKSTDMLAYMIKYDSVHGRFDGTVEPNGENELIVNGHKIRVTHEKTIDTAKWGDVEADYVLDCSGVYKTHEAVEGHLKAGAKKAVISCPPKDDIPIFVYGVNHEDYTPDMKIISNASCTTNCLAPVAKVIHDNFGIEKGLMTTVHAATINQTTVDARSKGGKDWRAGRATGVNIIPASTGAAKAVSKVIPSLSGKLTGMAFRVPTSDVSVVDLTVNLEKATTY
jgi:glyceraldehyde 3-phosphate dehydrogenase